MRLLLPAAIAAIGLAAPLAATPRGEDEIAKAIAGRTAGPPISCIEQHNIQSTTIVAETAILYYMRDGSILVNRPPNGTGFLHRDLTLITDTHDGDRLCNVDIVRLYDTASRFDYGSIGLGDFIPYPRVRK